MTKLHLEDLASLFPTTKELVKVEAITPKIVIERLVKSTNSRAKTTFVLQLRDKHPGLRHPTIDIVQCFQNIDKAEDAAKRLINTYKAHRLPFLSFIITECLVTY